MNIRVRVSFLISVFILWVKYSKAGELEHMVVQFLIFKGISTLFSTVAALIYIPTSSVRGFTLLQILANTYCYFLSITAI